MLRFNMKCHISSAVFDSASLYAHSHSHGFDPDSDEWNDYLQNVVCLLTPRNCLDIFIEKLRQSYINLRLHMVLNGFPIAMLPEMEIERLEHENLLLIGWSITPENEQSVMEVRNATFEQFMFPNWRQLPN